VTRNIFYCIVAVIGMSMLIPAKASSDRLTVVKVATVVKSNDRVNTENIQSNTGKPGWFIELSRRSARECGAKLHFEFIPWVRALSFVEQSKIDAIFNSNYTAKRATYGVYPKIDGRLDVKRASMEYGYFAYVLRDSLDRELVEQAILTNRNVVVERASSIIPELEKRGANIQENVNYLSMLKMVAYHRADAAIGIDKTFDTLLANTPGLSSIIMKVKTPIQLKFGYMMFSKTFYAAHPGLVECIWDKSAENRQTDWFRKLYQSYQ